MKLKLAWIEIKERDYDTGELVDLEYPDNRNIRFQAPNYERECWQQIAYFEIEEHEE